MPVEYHDVTPKKVVGEPLGLGPLGATPASGAGGNRVLVKTVATLAMTWYIDGSVADPSPATTTVEILRDDGTTLVAAGTSATRSSVGVFTFTLNATQTADLDLLTLNWTSSLGVVTTEAEIVGGFVFNIAQARTALSDQAYDVGKIRQAREFAETELEGALGYALVPRYARGAYKENRGKLRLMPYLRNVRSMSIGGTPISGSALTNIIVEGSYIYGYPWIGSSHSPIVVGYEHGMDSPPPGATQAGLALMLDNLGAGASGSAAMVPGVERLVTDDGTLLFGGTSSSDFFSDASVNLWVKNNRLPLVG